MRMSRTRGIRCSVTGSSVRSEAARIGKRRIFGPACNNFAFKALSAFNQKLFQCVLEFLAAQSLSDYPCVALKQ